jgi:uncharacterized membrane protein
MIRRDESEERFTRRLEAFSDIVIGFSLAQLGANLAAASHASKFFTSPLEIIAFLFPFAIICSVWFFHHRLFSQVFVPRALPVILNFVWLAVVVLLVFAAEAYTAHSRDATVIRAYFVCYALVYALLAVQNVIAAGYARARGDADMRDRALRFAAFMGLWTLPFVWSLVVVIFVAPGSVYGILLSLGFVVAGILSGALRRYFSKAQARQPRVA